MGKDLRGKDIGRGFSQRKDGRYEARAMINGIKICLYNMSLTKLRKEFDLAKANVFTDRKEALSNQTFQEWFDEWFESYKRPQLKTEISAKAYYRRVKNTYYASLGPRKINEVMQIDVQNATNKLLEGGYKQRTVKEALRIVKECFDIAVVNHIVKINPCLSISIKNNNDAIPERRVLAKWEQDMLLEEIRNEYYNEAYQILLLTGMRIGEFSGLQWQDIDFDAKVIRISRSMSVGYVEGKKIEELTTPKTANSYRDIPFFGETEKLLKEWKKKQDYYRKKLGERWRARPELGDLVFTSTMGSPVTRYVLIHNIEKIENNMRLKEEYKARKEGRPTREIKHIHPHAFRHTFATRCFEKGIDPLVVQGIMGHANYSMTISYTHILKDKLREELDRVGNFLE